jgi:hypothetical protein
MLALFRLNIETMLALALANTHTSRITYNTIRPSIPYPCIPSHLITQSHNRRLTYFPPRNTHGSFTTRENPNRDLTQHWPTAYEQRATINQQPHAPSSASDSIRAMNMHNTAPAESRVVILTLPTPGLAWLKTSESCERDQESG